MDYTPSSQSDVLGQITCSLCVVCVPHMCISVGVYRNIIKAHCSTVCVFCELRLSKLMCMWLQTMEMLLWSIIKASKATYTHAHFPCSILPFFSVNSRVAISTAEGDGRGIKVRNRHWHGRVRSGLWLASVACFHPRGFLFFQRADGLPYTRWLQRTSRPICVTNLLNKETHMLHQARFEDKHRPLRSPENFMSFKGRSYMQFTGCWNTLDCCCLL